MDEQQTIDFVLEVKKYPCLYNPRLSSYYRKTQTNKVWEKISQTMNISEMVCKEKWRNLRVVFVRHMKQSSIKNKRPYYLAEYMDFLLPFLKNHIQSKGEIIQTESTIANETSLSTCEAAPQHVIKQKEKETLIEEERNISTPEPKKKKLNESERLLNDKSRPLPRTSIAVTPFLNSLVPELEEMNLLQFKIFKRRVLSLIDEIMDEVSLSPSQVQSSLSIKTLMKEENIVEHDYTCIDLHESKYNTHIISAMSTSDDLNSVTSSPNPFEEKPL